MFENVIYSCIINFSSCYSIFCLLIFWTCYSAMQVYKDVVIYCLKVEDTCIVSDNILKVLEELDMFLNLEISIKCVS